MRLRRVRSLHNPSARSLMLMPTDPLNHSGNSATHDYIAALTGELADLARSAGDARLAQVLDLATQFAQQQRATPI